MKRRKPTTKKIKNNIGFTPQLDLKRTIGEMID